MRQVSTTPGRRTCCPRGRLLAVALLASVGWAALPGSPARAEEINAASVEAARRHFEKARGLYAQGSYREAIAELEAAHSLDPSAKDLVFNLGVVHEKLSDIDEALQWFQLYTTMNLTPPERERADAYMRRLEGAKKEVPPKPSASAAPPTSPEPPPPPQPTPPPAASAVQLAPVHGRADALTFTALGVTGAALIFGIVMGVKAEDDRPASTFVTGRDGTYAYFANLTSTAHRESIAADVGFGVSAAAGITAAILYFARTRDASDPVQGSPRMPSVSAAPLTGGGAVVVLGTL